MVKREIRKWATKRAGVITRKVYVDGYGNEKEVADMETSHIVNAIGYIQGKCEDLVVASERLNAAGIRSTALSDRIVEMTNSIMMLGGELKAREQDELTGL